MEAGILIDSFADFARNKNIDRPTMIRILEDVFRTMIRKKYKDDDNSLLENYLPFGNQLVLEV